MNAARRTTLMIVAALVALMAALAGVAQSAGSNPKTIRVSVKSNGDEVNSDNDFASVSASGRFVTFESGGVFTPNDLGVDADVFVHDRKTGKTTRVSVKSNGKEGTGDSEASSISASGRYVAFESDAALVGADTNGVNDVYVHDRKSGKTVRASVMSNGDQVFAESTNPSISADGRHVAFDSEGALVGTDSNGASDVYVHDLKTGKTKRVSLRSNGTEPSEDSTLSQDTSPNRARRISADGRFIAFQTSDPTMTGDPDCCSYPLFDTDVFVRDIKQGTTRRVSLTSSGAEADSLNQVASSNPTLSSDGRYVAFQTAGAFVAGDGNATADVYVKDLKTGKVQRVSVTSNGAEGTGSSTLPTISGDGRLVAFESESDLVGSDGNGYRDIYLRDRKTGKTSRVSVKSNGHPVDANHQLSAISANGKFVAFSSFGAFTGGDAGMDFDVFERGPLP